MHPLPRWPSCKSWQESLMCFKSKLCTCSLIQCQILPVAKPNKMTSEISPSYYHWKNALWVSKTALGQTGDGKQPSRMHSSNPNSLRGTTGLLTWQDGVSRHSNAKVSHVWLCTFSYEWEASLYHPPELALNWKWIMESGQQLEWKKMNKWQLKE